MFALLNLFFLGATLVWLRLDRTPPSWDDASYLANSLLVFDALAETGLSGYANSFLTLMGTKPPLIVALPTPVYLIFGRRPHAAYALNLIFLMILFGALYRLGKRYSNRRAGLLAVYIAGTMPVIYGLSRWYLVECGLMAIVCVAILLLAELDESEGLWKELLLGATCGLGLLMKASFPIYILVPMIHFAVRKRQTLRPVALAAISAPAALLALPWYIFNFRRAIKTALEAGSAQTAQIYGTDEVLSLSGIGNYLRNIADAGPALYFAALLLGLAFAAAARPAGKKGLRLCALWASPFVFLLFSHYREIRYAAPLYPAAALALAILIDFALERRSAPAKAAAYALLTLPLFGMLLVSFVPSGAALGRTALVGARLAYARRFDRTEWPLGSILGDIYHLTKFSGGEKKLLLVGTDSVRFNTDIFRLEAIHGKLPFDVATIAYERDLKTLLPLVDSAAFFVYREGGEPVAPFFNTLGAEALQEVRGSGRFVELPIARALPDGGVAHVFANRAPSRFLQSGAFLENGLEGLPDAKVMFGSMLQLTGLAVRRLPEGLEVKYRWRCVKPVDREYWCFTSVVDSRDGIAGYLDHPILNGEPPMTSWKPGDIVIERLLLPAAALRNGESYRIRLGLFHQLSGERLRITASDFPTTEDQTAAVVK